MFVQTDHCNTCVCSSFGTIKSQLKSGDMPVLEVRTTTTSRKKLIMSATVMPSCSSVLVSSDPLAEDTIEPKELALDDLGIYSEQKSINIAQFFL